MPPAPELGDCCRVVGGIEVVGEAEAHQECHANRHIGVAREVAIYLQCKAVNRHKRHHTAIAQLACKGGSNEECAERLCQDAILYESARNKCYGTTEVITRDRQARSLNLRNKLLSLDQRTKEHLREERQQKDIVREALQRLNRASIDIHHISDRLEYEERYTCRHHHAFPVESAVAVEVVDGVDKEVGSLEVGENRHIYRNAERHPTLATAILATMCHTATNEKVANGNKEQQQKVDARELVVEVERE